MPAHEVRRAAALALVLLAAACGGTPATHGGSPTIAPSTPVPSESPTGPIPDFASIDEAVAYIQARVDVPVVLPDPLPAGTRLAPDDPVYINDYDGRIGGQLYLVDGAGHRMFLQYGISLFDGCGGGDAKTTQVLDQAALYLTFAGEVEILWPATPDHPDGRYGIQARGTLAEVRAMAESMERARAAASAATIGC